MKVPQIIPMILDHMEEVIEDEWRPPRSVGSYRASELGDCPRAIQYTVKGQPRESPSPELALLFSDGHLHHHAVRTLLKAIGRVTNEEHQVSKQYEVSINGNRVVFVLTATTDGIFNGKYVFDIKSINFFSFKQLSKEWLEQNHVDYIYQLQTYLDIFDKELGFLLFKDKMTSALKIFWYKRDRALFKKILNKVAQIHLATISDRMIKRPYTKSSKECKRCPFREVCWGAPMERRTWS